MRTGEPQEDCLNNKMLKQNLFIHIYNIYFRLPFIHYAQYWQ